MICRKLREVAEWLQLSKTGNVDQRVAVDVVFPAGSVLPEHAGDDENNRQDWLRVAYAEAWKQYSHEDTLSLQRNNIFIIVETALLAALATTAAALLDLSPMTVGAYTVHLNLLVLGILTVAFAFFARRLLWNWGAVTESGQAYLELRWCACVRIECEAQIGGVSLAQEEGNLKKAIGEKQDAFHPYANYEAMKGTRIAPLGVDGWASVGHLIKALDRLWLSLGALGFSLIFLTVVLLIPAANELVSHPTRGASESTTSSPSVTPAPIGGQ